MVTNLVPRPSIEVNDGLVPIATMLVRMRWPLPEKHVIVYLACKPFRTVPREAMAEFHEALAYSLLCVDQQNLVLKAKQEEAVAYRGLLFFGIGLVGRRRISKPSSRVLRSQPLSPWSTLFARSDAKDFLEKSAT